MHPAKMPSLQPEITKSEITPTSSSSAESQASSTLRTPQMTSETADPANAVAGTRTHEKPFCEENDPLASVPLHWAQTRGIRKRNPNGCIGLPSDDFATEWARAARLSDARTSDELCAVLDHALSQANEISNKNGTGWEWWSDLTFRVEAAARILAPRLRNWRAEPETTPLAAETDSEPCRVTMTLSDPRKGRSMEEFAAWWRRLPAAQRIRYGGVCSPAALSDFDRLYKSVDDIAEQHDSTTADATAGSAASGEERPEPGDVLQGARRSTFQLSGAATVPS
jgi:hypothetical protein